MELLVLILDINPMTWGKRMMQGQGHSSQATTQQSLMVSYTTANSTTMPPFEHIFDQVCLYLQSFLLLHRGNHIAILGIHATDVRYLYTSPTSEASTENDEQLMSLKATLKNAIAIMLNDKRKSITSSGVNSSAPNTQETPYANSVANEQGTLLAAALSLAVCYFNRFKQGSSLSSSNSFDNSSTGSKSNFSSRRLLIISHSEDITAQYIPIMNGIFSLQKDFIVIDAVNLYENDSLFLQQMTQLSGGLYVKLSHKDQYALLQHLLMMFLPDANSRECLSAPLQPAVDFRATCFCHRQPIEIAYVCPVCLAIFCKQQPRCQICSTRFAIAIVRNVK